MFHRIKRKIKSLFHKPYRNLENRLLYDKFKGYNKCYILGTSPSINDFYLNSLDDAVIITMGNFHEHPHIDKIKPDIHVFSASHPPLTKTIIKKWWSRCENLLPVSTDVLIEKRDLDVADQVFMNRNFFSYSYGGNFPIDFTKKIISPGSVAQTALQLAIFLEIKEINFLGINHDWQRVIPYKHFYSHNEPSLEYYMQEEGIKIHYDEIKGSLPKEFLYSDYRLYQGYERLKKYADEQGIKIFNVDPSSPFDVFPRKEDKRLKK